MNYIKEFRDGQLAGQVVARIKAAAKSQKTYKLMEFCGGHTHAIYRYGIPSLLPANIKMIHGPGCPVCVLAISRIDYAIALAKLPNTIFCSYGDMLRVPGSRQQSLLTAKAHGADVRMVYSVSDALQIAQQNPNNNIIFFAIGFETTTPPTAFALIEAKKKNLKNFFIFCNHVLTPVAMAALLQDQQAPLSLDGFVGPAHVSIVIGSKAYQPVAERYKKPIVIAGFEPLDVLYSILLLIDMINNREYGVKNQYTRAVTEDGNIKSQQMIKQTMQLREQFEWRGLGDIKQSAWAIHPDYRAFDAEYVFPQHIVDSQEHKACDCASILRGIKSPRDCKLFAKACTPENPLGSCMVSSEGACAAYYAYGRHNIKQGTYDDVN